MARKNRNVRGYGTRQRSRSNWTKLTNELKREHSQKQLSKSDSTMSTGPVGPTKQIS